MFWKRDAAYEEADTGDDDVHANDAKTTTKMKEAKVYEDGEDSIAGCNDVAVAEMIYLTEVG